METIYPQSLNSWPNLNQEQKCCPEKNIFCVWALFWHRNNNNAKSPIVVATTRSDPHCCIGRLKNIARNLPPSTFVFSQRPLQDVHIYLWHTGPLREWIVYMYVFFFCVFSFVCVWPGDPPQLSVTHRARSSSGLVGASLDASTSLVCGGGRFVGGCVREQHVVNIIRQFVVPDLSKYYVDIFSKRTRISICI